MLLATAACGRSVPRSELLLLRCDLAQVVSHARFGVIMGAAPTRCWFATGWSPIDLAGHEMWSMGPRSVVHAMLAGRDAALRLQCTTAPPLVADGPLEVQVTLNGRPTGAFQLERAWERTTIEVPLADVALRPGMNEIALLPARRLNPGQIPGEPRPLAVLLYALEIRARLTPRERADYEAAAVRTDPFAPASPPPSAPGRPRRPRAAAGDQHAGQPPPDVLMILMDAARADHFGCYGYARATTPHVDALAAGGLALRNVHTPATYTLSAVASLFSARSWEEHGVVERGDALADSFATLAELLHSAGYYTMAFSPSPFVSPRTGLAQGFDEFFETWRPSSTPPGATGRTTDSAPTAAGSAPEDPEEELRWLQGRLAHALDAAPTFVYLHLLPPHEPYAPPPEDDLWSEPAYGGPVDGRSPGLRQLLEGALQPTAADLQHLRDLYDGNLHRADAAAARAITAWQALRRPRPLVVVVLADHGDALGEHGGYGHNLSVYDEVSHVPVVLWPAAYWSDVADPAALRSLADVAPMLLAALQIDPGVTSGWPAGGGDPRAGLEAPRPAVLLRGVPSSRAHGVRTARWLAVTDGFSRQQLFDVQEDPAQLTDLRLSRPETFRALVASLMRQVEATGTASAPDTTTPPPAPDPAAEEALRALGYN